MNTENALTYSTVFLSTVLAGKFVYNKYNLLNERETKNKKMEIKKTNLIYYSFYTIVAIAIFNLYFYYYPFTLLTFNSSLDTCLKNYFFDNVYYIKYITYLICLLIFYGIFEEIKKIYKDKKNNKNEECKTHVFDFILGKDNIIDSFFQKSKNISNILSYNITLYNLIFILLFLLRFVEYGNIISAPILLLTFFLNINTICSEKHNTKFTSFYTILSLLSIILYYSKYLFIIKYIYLLFGFITFIFSYDKNYFLNISYFLINFTANKNHHQDIFLINNSNFLIIIQLILSIVNIIISKIKDQDKKSTLKNFKTIQKILNKLFTSLGIINIIYIFSF